jgi:hypothetical protein
MKARKFFAPGMKQAAAGLRHDWSTPIISFPVSPGPLLPPMLPRSALVLPLALLPATSGHDAHAERK